MDKKGRLEKKWIKKEIKFIEQLIDFGFIGFAGTIIQLLILYSLTSYLSVYYMISAVIAFILTTFYSFIANRFITFHSRAGYVISGEKFFIVSLFSLFLNSSILFLLVEVGKIHYLISQTLAGLVLFTSTFFLHKYWSFNNKFKIKIPKLKQI